MTSASELFNIRRHRTGRNPDIGFSSSLFRTPSLHHHGPFRHHYGAEDCNQLTRRSSHGPSTARHLCHRVSPTEHESVRFDHSTSEVASNTGSGYNLGTVNSHSRIPPNDRLPGAVLQARARLFERLRGGFVAVNRQSRADRGISSDEFSVHEGGFGAVGHADGETGTADWLASATGAPVIDSNASEQLGLNFIPTFRGKPPGLSQEGIARLQLDVCVAAKGEGECKAVQECCICLERFEPGDVLICLPCDHRYHSGCLVLWVRTCGDCPYCRAPIVIDGGEESDP